MQNIQGFLEFRFFWNSMPRKAKLEYRGYMNDGEFINYVKDHFFTKKVLKGKILKRLLRFYLFWTTLNKSLRTLLYAVRENKKSNLEDNLKIHPSLFFPFLKLVFQGVMVKSTSTFKGNQIWIKRLKYSFNGLF